MALKQSLTLGLGQHLTMTPALQQAIRLLQLSTLDLRQEISEALESNLMLELEEEQGPASKEADEPRETAEGEDIPEELPVDAEWEDFYDTSTPGSSDRNDADLMDYRQASMHSLPSLREHLLWQAEVCGFSPSGLEIATHIIDAVNEDGYIQDWPALEKRMLEIEGATQALIRDTLTTVQDFDPPGVAARDPVECIALQLQQLPEETKARAPALQLVESGLLAFLAERRLGAIKQQLALDDETLESTIQLIQSLNPRPGSTFADTDSSYVIPEVFVSKKEGRWVVSLNPEIAPRLRINDFYYSLIKRADQSEEQQTLKTHLQEARYFLNSLKSRNETLLRVAQTIVEEQRAFMEYGEEAMKPMILRDISERLGVHESTVSRATANKYMHTPRGLFELKYFFSSHVSTTSGGTCSATAIQAMIKRLIQSESPGKPLSDSRLAHMLLNEGVQVARRTVAKYREAMNIPPSHERKHTA